ADLINRATASSGAARSSKSPPATEQNECHSRPDVGIQSGGTTAINLTTDVSFTPSGTASAAERRFRIGLVIGASTVFESRLATISATGFLRSTAIFAVRF